MGVRTPPFNTESPKPPNLSFKTNAGVSLPGRLPLGWQLRADAAWCQGFSERLGVREGLGAKRAGFRLVGAKRANRG